MGCWLGLGLELTLLLKIRIGAYAFERTYRDVEGDISADDKSSFFLG